MNRFSYVNMVFSYLLGDAVRVAGAVDVHDLGDALSPVDVVHSVLVPHVGDVALVEQQDVRAGSARRVSPKFGFRPDSGIYRNKQHYMATVPNISN